MLAARRSLGTSRLEGCGSGGTGRPKGTATVPGNGSAAAASGEHSVCRDSAQIRDTARSTRGPAGAAPRGEASLRRSAPPRAAPSLMPQPGPGRARRCPANRGQKWPSGGPGLVRARGPGGTRPRDTAPPLRLPAAALRLRQPSGTQNLSPPPRERGRSCIRSREGFQTGLSPCITLAVG